MPSGREAEFAMVALDGNPTRIFVRRMPDG
jgi:hypothetical protein